MRKFLLLIVMMGLMFGCAGSMKMREPAALTQQMGSMTVALVAQELEEDEDGKILGLGEVAPYCTGVWVSENEFLTAFHCVRDLGDGEEDVVGLNVHYIVEGEVDQVGTEPTGWHLAEIKAVDSDHDLALIKALGKMVPAHMVAEVASESPGVGEEVHLVGHVRGLYWTYIDGKVAAYRGSLPGTQKWGPFLQMSSAVFYGNSGGGVFDRDGKLVGIVSFMSRAPMTNFAIHLDSIKYFLKEAHS